MTAPNTTPNSVPAWIAAACASALVHPTLSHPWEFDWSGERWTIGTNGHIAALARGQFGAPDANVPNSGAPNFLAILGVPPGVTRRTVDLDALRAWLGVELNAQYWGDGVRYLRAAEEKIATPTLFDLDAVTQEAA